MTDWQLKTPVAFLIFNRPETTLRVFERIREAKPPKLMVIADGPRSDRPEEAEKCAAARAIIDRIDWPCDVQKNYSDVNLGCKWRVSSGLDWVFNNVEEAIILEDDCLPDPTFFRFCDELLERYRDDKRVMMISGDNFHFGQRQTVHSYYFSRYANIWGWATWRRAWALYDVDMKSWPEISNNNLLFQVFNNKMRTLYWAYIFDKVYRGEIDTWDYQWTYNCLINSGLSIMPNVNLVSNIGFNEQASRTFNRSSILSCMTVEPMNFPLSHPSFILRNTIADEFTEKVVFPLLSFSRRTTGKLKGILRRIFGHISK